MAKEEKKDKAENNDNLELLCLMTAIIHTNSSYIDPGSEALRCVQSLKAAIHLRDHPPTKAEDAADLTKATENSKEDMGQAKKAAEEIKKKQEAAALRRKQEAAAISG